MRVLLISHTCQSRREGQPKAREIAALGVELCVLVPQRWKAYGKWHHAETPPVEEANFRLEVRPTRLPWAGPAQTFLHTYPSLPRLLREFRPDVIDLWEEPWSRVSVQALRLRDRLLPHAKLVSETEQNIDKRLPPPFEGYRRKTLAGCDFAIGRSREAVEVLRAKGYSGPARVVPNAVDAELFRVSSNDEREATRTRLGLGGFVVGYVGRLTPEKGLDDLIDALPPCDATVNLLLVGGGEAGYERSLRERADRLGVANRVRFHGPVPLGELPPVMAALDVLALPSRTTARWKEQFGRVLIEASACGVPLIGSSSGAIPDVVGDAGLTFPEGDAAALAAAVETLRRDEPRRREMGRLGRERVEAQFTWRRVAEAMVDIYEQLQTT